MPDYSHFEFDENGIPHPVEARVKIRKETVSALLPAALSMPYEPIKVPFIDVDGRPTGELIIPESEFRYRNPDGTWMSKAEVGAMRLADGFARGEEKPTAQVLDRILGKPKQEVATTNTNMTFQDWLAIKAQEEASKQQITISIPTPPQIEQRDGDELGDLI